MKTERKALEILKFTYELVYVLACLILLVDLFFGLSFLPITVINIIGNALSLFPVTWKGLFMLLGFISK